MRCEECRDALSARLDGELDLLAAAAVERHLRGCAPCRAHAARLDDLHRVVRMRPADAVPDQTEQILARAAVPPGRVRALTVARVVVALVGVAHIVLSAPALIFGEDAHAPMHVAHEMGTFGVALGIGLVMAAWRTERAVGMLPFAGVLALTLAVTATIDVAAARRTLTEELPHLIDMVALMGLWVVARRAREAHTVADRGARWPALA